MDDPAQQGAALSAVFPPPPPFYQSFTPENIKTISSLRAAEPSARKDFNPATSLPPRILDLPPELRYLQPPVPPTEGKFRCFGDVYDLQDPLPSLEAMGVQQVYTPPATPSPGGKHKDRAFILKRLAKSLLLNFLELVGIMSTNPEQYPEKVADIRTLFVNFHHLLNEYRPHQARESLILMMQEQLDRARNETNGIREMKKKVEMVLEGLGQTGLAEEESGKDQEEEVDEGKDIWEVLEKEFG